MPTYQRRINHVLNHEITRVSLIQYEITRITIILHEITRIALVLHEIQVGDIMEKGVNSITMTFRIELRMIKYI